MGQNDHDSLLQRRDAGTLSWKGPALILLARTVFAVAAQGVVAAIFALRGSAEPWKDAEPWLPVYGTLIDAGCLALLWRFTRREGIGVFDLVNFDQTRLGRELLLGLALIPPSLAFIIGGNYAASWLVYGTISPAFLFGPLPLPAALYGVLVFPIVWGLTEQMTYNGYLVSRFQVLSGSTILAVACVAFVWSLQHSFMPLTFDAKFMIYRLLSPLPYSVFGTLLYLHYRRLVPFIVAHALMDGASVVIGVLIPALKT